MGLIKNIVTGIVTIIFVIVIILFAGSEVTNNTDTYIYGLPFKIGEQFRVVQGYGGQFSHRNKAALDFAMPVGTPIFAARPGVIYSYKDNSSEGGPFPRYQYKANYILIRHDDGSFGCYWHLKQKGVVVKNGRVEKGQLIGYSGSTGFVIRPHLHFAVKKKLTYDMNSFVRTMFRTTAGNCFLEVRHSYMNPE